jgi:hypothetical protein
MGNTPPFRNATARQPQAAPKIDVSITLMRSSFPSSNNMPIVQANAKNTELSFSLDEGYMAISLGLLLSPADGA